MTCVTFVGDSKDFSLTILRVRKVPADVIGESHRLTQLISVNKGTPYGTMNRIEKMVEKFDLILTTRLHGCPRKDKKVPDTKIRTTTMKTIVQILKHAAAIFIGGWFATFAMFCTILLIGVFSGWLSAPGAADEFTVEYFRLFMEASGMAASPSFFVIFLALWFLLRRRIVSQLVLGICAGMFSLFYILGGHRLFGGLILVIQDYLLIPWWIVLVALALFLNLVTFRFDLVQKLLSQKKM